MESPPKYRRRIKLIKPGLQLRMIASFLGITVLGFLLQGLLLGLLLAETATEMPQGGSHLMAALPKLPIEVFLLSCGIFLPLVLSVGVVVTFRIAGPVYRFEQYLQSVERGEPMGPCRLRKGDELQGLSELITRVTAPLRSAVGDEEHPDHRRHEPAPEPVAPVGEGTVPVEAEDTAQDDLREAG